MSDNFSNGVKDNGPHPEHVDDSYANAHDPYTEYPNRWARIRAPFREYAAEFLGTMVLVIFGTAVDCQVVLSTNTDVASSAKGSYLSISFGWACGTALGVWLSAGISGGHINPAVTLALAVWRDFPWRKVPGYIVAQVMGALCGAACVYANYFHAIDIYEGGRGIRSTPGTAGLFATYSASYLTNQSAFFDEFLGTALLVLVVLAVTDRKNSPPPSGLVPLVLFITVLGIGTALGFQTAYAINPARDFGPRILTAMVGYGKDVFTYRNQYWIWCPILAPILGGQVATLLYDAFLYTGSESLLNRPNATNRRLNQAARPEQSNKLPGGIDNRQGRETSMV
ncbi:hypothetical protein PLICRDRAFT_173481 [Plicaturopsis crispa FD-325 SS-3]|nr:hypothetical protein PLICRDRAFT_173481 [Plicaturopsis crispa FD-325 SS-3]